MANNTYTSQNKIGVGFHRRTTNQEHKLGELILLDSTIPGRLGRLGMYVKASGAIAASNYVTVALSSISCLATSVDGGAGTAYCRNGSVAFVDGEYGWVLVIKTAFPQGSNT